MDEIVQIVMVVEVLTGWRAIGPRQEKGVVVVEELWGSRRLRFKVAGGSVEGMTAGGYPRLRVDIHGSCG
jgi:hypothetical protein